MQMPNINDQILNSGVDEETIDAQIIDEKPAKKKKLVALLSIIGIGLVVGGGYMMYADQKRQAPVSPDLQRILSGAGNHSAQQAPAQAPVAIASAQPGLSATPATETPVTVDQVKPPSAESKPIQAVPIEKMILLEKKVEQMAEAVEALKAKIEKVPRKASVDPSVTSNVSKKPLADLPIKTINLKESGIMAVTVNSLIVFYGGKNQEIFIGDTIPGIGEKLVGSNPIAHEFTTNRAIYRPVSQ